MFAGHDQDVDCVAWHPNNAYVFTGSSDKTVRMWDVSRGTPVRMLTGHTANVTAVSCAPNGKILASADDSGSIILWNLSQGRRIKRMRGHGRGGIWSLSWSVESSLLTSAGADGTVRIWDVLAPGEGQVGTAAAAAGVKGVIAGVDGAGTNGVTVNGTGKVDGRKGAAAAAQPVNALAKAGAGKEAGITPDQISAFPTKKSPVYKVRFTNMNLVVAGGCYMP